MNLIEAEDVLIERLIATPDAPSIVLPDDSQLLAAPRWVVQRSSPNHTANGLDGAVEGRAELLVRVETERGQFSQSNNELVVLLVQRFAVGLSIGGVSIKEPPDIRPSLVESGLLVTPVIIRGRFYQQPLWGG